MIILNTRSLISPNIAKYRQISPNIAKYRQISPNIAKYRQISPNIAKYRQISPNIASALTTVVTRLLEVLYSALTTIKSAINEMADYFAVEVDKPVHLHPLMGKIAPTLKDSLGDLSIASDGKTQASDYNCTRGTVFLRGRLGFWLQVTPVALEWINSMGSLVWICGEPVNLQLEKSLYVPSRAEQAAAMETEENAPEKEAEEEGSMEFDAYEQEQMAMHSGQQSRIKWAGQR